MNQIERYEELLRLPDKRLSVACTDLTLDDLVALVRHAEESLRQRAEAVIQQQKLLSPWRMTAWRVCEAIYRKSLLTIDQVTQGRFENRLIRAERIFQPHSHRLELLGKAQRRHQLRERRVALLRKIIEARRAQEARPPVRKALPAPVTATKPQGRAAYLMGRARTMASMFFPSRA